MVARVQVYLVLALVLVACQPAAIVTEAAMPTLTVTETATASATVTLTASAVPATLKPTRAATATRQPSKTPEPDFEATVVAIRENLCKVVISLEGDIGIERVNLCKIEGGILSIELRTDHYSRDSQPDVSFDLIQILAELGDVSKDRFERVLDGPDPRIQIVTYSADGGYKYASVTDYETLIRLYKRSISYDEWIDAAGAGFVK